MKQHRHYWHYPWVVWSGSGANETTVARYCACGVVQTAKATQWRKATARHEPDLLKFCRDRLKHGERP